MCSGLARPSARGRPRSEVALARLEQGSRFCRREAIGELVVRRVAEALPRAAPNEVVDEAGARRVLVGRDPLQVGAIGEDADVPGDGEVVVALAAPGIGD